MAVAVLTHSMQSHAYDAPADTRDDRSRWRRALIGAAIVGAAGVIVGVRHGNRVDRACGGDNQCSGPPLAPLIDGVVYGSIGVWVGGAIGWEWP